MSDTELLAIKKIIEQIDNERDLLTGKGDCGVGGGYDILESLLSPQLH